VRTQRAEQTFSTWLPVVTPAWNWDWPHLKYIREQGLDRVTSGEIKRLMIFCPPRHGKTEQDTVRYPAWRLERDPELRVIVAAYNQTLAKKFSRKIRRIAGSRMELSRERKAAEEWETLAGGGVRAAGIGVGVTGMGTNLLMIDDPIKGRAQANSQVFRDAVYEWYTDDLYTRLEPDAAIVLTLTRWHEDDLAGRILASEDGPNWTVISLPALAEDNDPLGRAVGVALCPDRYDEAALARIARVLGKNFLALYQQRPTAQDGDMFKREWFPLVGAIPVGCELVRYWDKAGTEGAGCYTAGVLMARGDGYFFVVDVVRGQWSAHQREKVIKQTAERDREIHGKRVRIWVEEEGGSGGKESAENTIRNLAGFPVKADRVAGQGDKFTRAQPFADQAEAGNVKLVRDSEARRWNAAYMAELLAIPNGKFKDQLDASSGSFNKLCERRKMEVS
jgi:predicted phage terminase large subunit-like protein